MELGCFTSPLCWCVLFVEQVARAISVCLIYSVVTPLRKDQSSEMSPGLYRGANTWHIWSGLKSWNLSEYELQGCLLIYFIFGFLWNLKGCTKSGTGFGAYREPSMFLPPPKSFSSCLHLLPLSLIYTLASPTKQLSLPSHSHWTGTLKEEVDLPISHTQKHSSTEISKAMVFLFWVGLFPSQKGNRKYQEITFLQNC